MVDKTTPRLGLPVPYLTNPLKIDVGKLTDALTMLDKNAVMLTDWDITSDSWQKMGKISNLAQGKIAITLMVVTGTGFANIVMQTGDGSVTTVGDPARITVTAQTNLGANSATILGGKLVEVAADTYEIWFNIAPSTAPRKWTGLLIAGNGATIDWTHTSGAQPAGGVNLAIARSLTDQEIASPTITRDGAVLTAAYAGLMGIKLPYFDFAATGDTITSHIWRVGETMRVKAADATTANGFPAGVTGAGASGWRIHCEGINEDRSSTVFIFASEGATPTWVYRITRTTTNWSAPRRMYTSDNPPAASEVKAVAQMDGISTVINLNDRILPAHYGVVSLTSATGAVAANNFPFDEPGQLTVFPFGASGGVTQVYIAKSGRIASRSYDGSVFTDWRKGANAGANDDITSLTNLSGPLKLGGDGVGDYDAVTMRQLKATTGTGGATMNGVVNSFIGAVDWFNGSRALVPAGYIPADGGVYSRAAYPELWNAISKGILANVSDAEWLAGVSTGAGATLKTSTWAHRGKYSTGGEAGTAPAGSGVTDAWFRVPDLNGIQTGSASGLFLRGSGSGPISVGSVAPSSLPDIQGNVTTNNGWMFTQGGGGALKPYGATSQVSPTTSPATGTTQAYLEFKASYSSGIYGKITQYLDSSGTPVDWAANEVKPPQVVGIWLIRASGSFQAANTNFSVITGDAARPSNNTAVFGGGVISDYQVAGVSEAKSTLRSAGTIAGNYVTRISTYNKTKNVTKDFDFYDDGRVTIPGGLITAAGGDGSTNGNVQITNGSFYAGRVFTVSGTPSAGSVFTGAGIWLDGNQGAITGKRMQSGLYTEMVWGGVTRTMISTTDQVGPVTKYWFFNSDGSLAGPNGVINPVGSDIKLKDDVVPAAEGALARIMKIQPKEFSWKSDGRPDRGYIAQDLQKIDPLYVFESFGHRKGDEVLNVSQTALLADLIASVQDLQAQITELKK